MFKFKKRHTITLLSLALLSSCGSLVQPNTPTNSVGSNASIGFLFPQSTSKVTEYFKAHFAHNLTSSSPTTLLIVDIDADTLEHIQSNPILKAAIEAGKKVLLTSNGSVEGQQKMSILSQLLFDVEIQVPSALFSPLEEGGFGVVAIPGSGVVQQLGTSGTDVLEAIGQEVTQGVEVNEALSEGVKSQLAHGNDGERRIWPVRSRIQYELPLRGAIFYGDKDWSTANFVGSLKQAPRVVYTLAKHKCLNRNGCYYGDARATVMTNAATTFAEESKNIASPGLTYDQMVAKFKTAFTNIPAWTKHNYSGASLEFATKLNSANSPKAKYGQCLVPTIAAREVWDFYRMEGLWFRTSLSGDRQEVKWEPWNAFGTIKYNYRQNFIWRVKVLPKC